MLVTMKEILSDAHKKRYAVGAFNTPNLESVMAVISAAEEENTPVILQHAQVHENLISLEIIGPILLDFARKASVPVCVHLDHGESFTLCMRAIQLGFTSIMYDASAKSFEENLSETKEIARISHSVNVSVEAELGHIFTSAVGGGEGRSSVGAPDYKNVENYYTDPEAAREFVRETKVDALAISFGTTHGVYLTKPVLDLDRIALIKNNVDIPFVMHGGSGLSDEDYKTAIKNGITKINYYTYMAMAGGLKAAEEVKKSTSGDRIFFHDIALAGIAGMKDNVRKIMRVLYGK